ncbi:M23 family metallopeptidase [Luteibacter yeojuensis]
MRAWIWVAGAAATMGTGLHARTVPDPAPVEARVPWAPTVFTGSDGARHFAYELHLTNFYGDTGPLTLDGVDVFADGSTRPLLHLDRTGVAAVAKPVPKDGTAAVVDPGKRGIVYVWITLPPAVPVPRQLRHHMDMTTNGHAFVVDGVDVTVPSSAAPVIGPPLHGGHWLAHEGPGASRSHHWGSMVAINGSLTVPQRYAIDFVGVDGTGRAIKASAKDLQATRYADWIGYGAEVIAVADGVVAGARDGEEEHAPLKPQPEPSSLTTDGLFGNYVVLSIGPGQYAGYAHLAKGSVRVKKGDHVRRGQVIGRLGQSGNSAAPHLHFQLANAPEFQGSEGIPYVFDRIDLYGEESEAQLFGQGDPWKATPADHRQAQLPLDGMVVSFPDN